MTSGLKMMELPKIEPPPPPVIKAPALPKTPKPTELKLTTPKGTKRPLFTSELKDGSPYNPN